MPRHLATLGWLLSAALPALVLSGCASDPMLAVRESYAAGDYRAAHDQLNDLAQADSGNAQVYALEQGVVELALGDPKASEQQLRRARDLLDEVGQNNAVDWLQAALLDDRQLEYGGADYEQVLVRAMLALDALLRRSGDAAAYAVQVLERQREIIDSFGDGKGPNPKRAYKLVAFGTYLRAIMDEEDPLKASDAHRAFEQVRELAPNFRDGKADVERRHYSAKGNGVVHVLALVGRAPFRVEAEEQASQTALAIAQTVWAISRDRVTFPNISRVVIPQLAFHADNPTTCFVEVDGRTAGTTATVTDVEATARAEFEAMRDHIIARAVLRRALKIAITEGLKEVVNPKKRKVKGHRSSPRRDRRQEISEKEANPLIDLAISLAGLLWTSAESADLRCWSLLPADFEVLRLELPAGEHDVVLRAGRHAPTGRPQTVRVDVRDGANTYVVALLPTLDGGPPPLTSLSASPTY